MDRGWLHSIIPQTAIEHWHLGRNNKGWIKSTVECCLAAEGVWPLHQIFGDGLSEHLAFELAIQWKAPVNKFVKRNISSERGTASKGPVAEVRTLSNSEQKTGPESTGTTIHVRKNSKAGFLKMARPPAMLSYQDSHHQARLRWLECLFLLECLECSPLQRKLPVLSYETLPPSFSQSSATPRKQFGRMFKEP